MNHPENGPASESQQRIAALVETLRTIEQELHERTGGKMEMIQGLGELPLRLRKPQANPTGLEIEARRLRESQAVANIGSWETDLSTLEVAWTEQTHRIFETSPEHFTPTHQEFLARVHPDDRAAVDAALDKSVGKPGPFAIEHRLLFPDGRIKFIEERWRIFYDAEGKLTRALGTCQDITERKQTEESLAQSQTLIRIAGQSALLGGWSLQLPNHQITWSDETFLIHDLPPGKTPSLDQALEFYLTEYRLMTTRHIELCAEQGTPFDFEAEIVTAKQRRIWIRVIGEAIRDGSNRILRIQGAVQDISRQKAAEARLRASEASLLQAQRIARIGNWDWNIATDEIYWSPQVFHLFGLDPLDATVDYQTFLQGVHPGDREQVDQAVQASVMGGRYDIKHRVLWPDGTVRWMHEQGETLRDAEGRALSMSGTVQDITERIKAEEALRMSEERFRLMIEGSDRMMFYTHDLEHRFEYLSPSVLAVLGYEPEDLIGQTFHVLLIPDDPTNNHIDELTEKALQDGVPSEPYLAMVRHKDGRHLVMEIVECPMRIDGRIVGMQSFANDITERETARHALAASEREFRNLAESMPQIVWVTGPDGKNTYLNRNWLEYTGMSLEESLGDGWNQAFHAEEKQRAWDAWQEAVTSTRPYMIECRIRRADGAFRWWLIRGEPQLNPAGNVLKWFGTCTDIHDFKIAEMEISRTNRALKLLSGCNAALIHADDEMALLHDICQLAVDTGGYRMAWVGYAMDDREHSIRPMAHAGCEDGYLEEIKINWDAQNPVGRGPGGQSIRSGKPVVCEDMEHDPDFHWLAAARQRGYRSVICLPLRDKDRTFGMLGLYASEAIVRNAEEERLLQEMADDLAFGIINIRDRIARWRLQDALVNVSSAISTTTGKDFFEQLATSMAAALGAEASFVAKILPDMPLTARTIAVVVDGEPAENFKYVLEGTPCENLTDSDTCIISSEVAQQFPRSPGLTKLGAQSYVGRRLNSSTGKFLGLLFVLFREPLQESGLVDAMLRIFAARAAAELERQETDARLREQAALLDKAQDAILVRDLDHTILYWNHSAERLYGWTAAEAVGRSVRDLLYRCHKAFDSAFDAVLSHGEWVGEIQQITKNGTVVMVEGHWSLVNSEDGNARSILAINTDITERKQIEAQYLRAQRMESIGTLAGGIAHDLNNVLAPIMMSIELLKMNEKDARSLNMLTTIEGSAKRGADMVRQVLSFARGVEGQQLQVQVGHLVKEIEKIVQDTFLKNITVTCNIASDLWFVQGDPTQLHQVLLNLCINARDAMPNGGTLTLTATNIILDEQYAGMNIDAKPGSHVCIQIEDSGTGMPPEVCDRIFEPFFTTKELGKGTGLGLSSSLAIIKGHGGFIRVYSEVGMGTRFRLYLPAQTEPGTENDPATSTELPRGNGELVMVVDDEAAVREITRQTLETFGYRVVMALDGVEATSIYANRKQEIAVVLTDMMMPLMDGPTTIQVLLKMNPHARIIAASGLNANGMVAKASNAGVKHFLPKPYTAESLLKTLRNVIES